MKKQNKKAKKKQSRLELSTKKIIAMALTVIVLVWLAGLTILVQGLIATRDSEAETNYHILAKTAYKDAFVPLVMAPESKRVFAPAMDLSFAYSDGVENILVSQDYSDDKGAREFVITSVNTVDNIFNQRPSEVMFDCGKLLFVTTSDSQRDTATAVAQVSLSDGRTLRAYSAGKDGACKQYRDQADLDTAINLVKSAQAFSL